MRKFVFFVVASVLLSQLSGLAATDCPRAPSLLTDLRREPNKLRIATYNAEWLFDGIDDPSFSKWQTPEEAQAHIEDVAQVIKKIDADILNVVEVKNCDVLHQIIDLVPELNYSAYLVQGKDTATQQNVAILSRISPVTDLQRTEHRSSYPLEGSNCGYTNQGKSTGVSKHYFTRFDIPINNTSPDRDENATTVASVSFVMFGMHLKAIPTQPRSCGQREGQTAVMQQYIRDQTEAVEQQMLNQYFENLSGSETKFHENTVNGFRGILDQDDVMKDLVHVIALGDLNDWDSGIQDVGNNTPTSRAVEMVRESLPNRPLLNAVHQIQNITTRFSEWYDRNNNNKIDAWEDELSLIDHILISNNTWHLVSDVQIMTDLYWETDQVSDHWPIYVDFDLSRLWSQYDLSSSSSGSLSSSASALSSSSLSSSSLPLSTSSESSQASQDSSSDKSQGDSQEEDHGRSDSSTNPHRNGQLFSGRWNGVLAGIFFALLCVVVIGLVLVKAFQPGPDTRSWTELEDQL